MNKEITIQITAKDEYLNLLKIFVLLSSSNVYKNELKNSKYDRDTLNILFDNMDININENLLLKEKNIYTQNIIDELCIYSNTLTGYDKVMLDYLLLVFVLKKSFHLNNRFKRNLLMETFNTYYEIPTFRVLLNEFLNACDLLFRLELLNVQNNLNKSSSMSERMVCIGHFF